MRKLLLSLCLVAFLVPVSGQKVVQRIQHLGEDNARMTGSFVESHIYPKQKKKTPEYYEGTFVFVAPDSLALNYTKPEGDYMWMNEKQLVIRHRGENQKFAVKSTTSQKGMLKRAWQMACTGEIEKLAKELEMKITPSENQVRMIVKLEKKHMPDSGICTITIMYGKIKGEMLYLKLEEVNGNYTLWEMSEVVSKHMQN